VKYVNDMTTMTAIMGAGGFIESAALGRVTMLVRRGDQVFKLKLSENVPSRTPVMKVIQGETVFWGRINENASLRPFNGFNENFQLRPNDTVIVTVPMRLF
jgi:hypothetical protein